jgi:hypothetical protein
MGEWRFRSGSCPGHVTPGQNVPFTHWLWGCVGPGASLDAVEEKKNLASLRNRTLIPYPSSLYPVTISTELFLLHRINVLLQNAFGASVTNI